MNKIQFDIKNLKEILEKIATPEDLNAHLWAEKLFVKEIANRELKMQDKDAGERLLYALAEQFRAIQPSTPPKQGIRLDTRWCEFGFLAAKYFAPILYGTPIPASFEEAWGRMDQCILLFVFNGKANEEIPAEEIERYRLVGNENEVTPISTISDWNRKGLQKLADALASRENYLSIHGVDDPSSMEEEGVIKKRVKKKRIKKKIFPTLAYVALILFLLLVYPAYKGWLAYQAGMKLYEDLQTARAELNFPPSLSETQAIGDHLKILQADVDELKRHAKPFLWIAPYLKGIPDYGCDISAAGSLLDMADQLTDMGVSAFDAAQPTLKVLASEDERLTPAILARQLDDARLQLVESLEMTRKAINAREQIDAECLSPQTSEYIQMMDPYLVLLEESLRVAIELPQVLGATEEGPKTYLLLAQNEDELRPTGGFITAASSLLIQNGQIKSLDFVNSGYLDNWDRPYPSAPIQLRLYMNSQVLIFRDSNWFTNYPRTALYAEYLYAYKVKHSVDGVIAFNQHFLIELLKVIGPLNLNSAPEPIDHNNVVQYMRDSKENVYDEQGRLIQIGADKAFMNEIAFAMIDRLVEGKFDWTQLIRTVSASLNERHLLLQFDNPELTDFIARRHWDGDVLSGNNDFLMVVDSNVSFNKTNALIETHISYETDLTNLDAPTALVSVTHKNNSNSIVPCVQWNGYTLEGQDEYPMDRCYWDYLRVYKSAGSKLLDSNPQEIPADWMIRRRKVPAVVDLLGDEEIAGVDAFGVLKIVPGGKEITSKMSFALPETIWAGNDKEGQKTYRLRIQKQAGTVAVPISIKILLPNGAEIVSAPDGAVVDGRIINLEKDLRLDVEIEVAFTTP